MRPEFRVTDSGLYLETPAQQPGVHESKLILTKEAFIECYKKWISSSEQETKPTLESMSLMNDYKL